MSSPAPRRYAVGSDTAHPIVEALIASLTERGIEVVTTGAAGGPETPWPDVAEAVALNVTSGTCDGGIVCCWTGTGVSIAANKVPGARAALCGDAETACGARKWNDANILALALQSEDVARALSILDAWLEETSVDPAERANIERLTKIERARRT